MRYNPIMKVMEKEAKSKANDATITVLEYLDIDDNKVVEKFTNVNAAERRKKILLAHGIEKVKIIYCANWTKDSNMQSVYNPMTKMLEGKKAVVKDKSIDVKRALKEYAEIKSYSDAEDFEYNYNNPRAFFEIEDLADDDANAKKLLDILKRFRPSNYK